MTATQQEKKSYGSDIQVVSRGEDCAVYQATEKTGELQMTSHEVFPGITLIYQEVNLKQYGVAEKQEGRVYELNHCLEGRMECETGNAYFYLTPGDLSISKNEQNRQNSGFPLGRYYGITIRIDSGKAPGSLSCFLDDVNVNPSQLMERILNGSDCFVLRADARLAHIFSELYSVPDSIKKGYLKVKVLELFLFLEGMDPGKEEIRGICYPESQVKLAKRACAFITAHMDVKVTIDQLARMFHVSATQLKNSFRGVYGVSVYSYARTQKMHAAALMLKETDHTILDVAGRFGYDNGSKFAKAFRDVMGVSPKEYRQMSKNV